MLHSDMPPTPARSVSGIKTVVINVSLRIVRFVLLAVIVIWLFWIEKKKGHEAQPSEM